MCVFTQKYRCTQYPLRTLFIIIDNELSTLVGGRMKRGHAYVHKQCDDPM